LCRNARLNGSCLRCLQGYQWRATKASKACRSYFITTIFKGYHLCFFHFLAFPGCPVYTGLGLRRSLHYKDAARNFVWEGPVTDLVRVQSSAILHKDHFECHSSIFGRLQQDMSLIIFYQSASINFKKQMFALVVTITKQPLSKQFSMNAMSGIVMIK